MKITINIDGNDDGLKGDFSIVVGELGRQLVDKLKALIGNPDEVIGRIGNAVMDNVLYGGRGSKTEDSGGSEPSSGFTGY